MTRLSPLKYLLLDALSKRQGGITTWTLLEPIEGQLAITLGEQTPEQALAEMLADGLVDRVDQPGIANAWSITELGRAKMIASDAFEIFGEMPRNFSTLRQEADGCASENPRSPSKALVCVDEDELELWFDELDVEEKALAFTLFSLHGKGEQQTLVEVLRSPVSVPVAGSVGLRHWAKR